MSKALAVKDVVSPRVSISTLDGSSSLVLDQAAGTDTIVASTSAAAKGVLVKSGTDSVHLRSGQVALSASSSCTATAPVASLATLDGNSSLVLDQAAGDTIAAITNSSARGIMLQSGGNDFLHLSGNDQLAFATGNVVLSGSKVALSGSEVVQAMEVLDNAAALNPAAASYAVLDSAAIPAIAICSRLNIFPGGGGTLIHSIVALTSGHEFQFQNLGTGNLVFVNQSGLGTGVLIRGPGDYTVPPGGGVVVMYDAGQNFYMVRGI